MNSMFDKNILPKIRKCRFRHILTRNGIENKLGRDRTNRNKKHMSRTADLDIIFKKDQNIGSGLDEGKKITIPVATFFHLKQSFWW